MKKAIGLFLGLTGSVLAIEAEFTNYQANEIYNLLNVREEVLENVNIGAIHIREKHYVKSIKKTEYIECVQERTSYTVLAANGDYLPRTNYKTKCKINNHASSFDKMHFFTLLQLPVDSIDYGSKYKEVKTGKGIKFFKYGYKKHGNINIGFYSPEYTQIFDKQAKEIFDSLAIEKSDTKYASSKKTESLSCVKRFASSNLGEYLVPEFECWVKTWNRINI